MAEGREIRHEPAAVDLRGIGVGAGAIAIGIAIALAVPWLFLARASAPANAPNDAVKPQLAAPVQETAPLADIAGYRREKAHRLESYGIDSKTGAAHIPIERAMALLAQDGARR